MAAKKKKPTVNDVRDKMFADANLTHAAAARNDKAPKTRTRRTVPVAEVAELTEQAQASVDRAMAEFEAATAPIHARFAEFKAQAQAQLTDALAAHTNHIFEIVRTATEVHRVELVYVPNGDPEMPGVVPTLEGDVAGACAGLGAMLEPLFAHYATITEEHNTLVREERARVRAELTGAEALLGERMAAVGLETLANLRGTVNGGAA